MAKIAIPFCAPLFTKQEIKTHRLGLVPWVGPITIFPPAILVVALMVEMRQDVTQSYIMAECVGARFGTSPRLSQVPDT